MNEVTAAIRAAGDRGRSLTVDRYFYIRRYMEPVQALRILSALGQDTRLNVFRLLVQAGPDGLPAGEIAERVGARQNTMSSHLSILANSGLVRSERFSRVIRYSVDFDVMRGLLAFLLEDCCGGRRELCQPLIDQIACAC